MKFDIDWTVFAAIAAFIIFFAMLFDSLQTDMRARNDCRKMGIEKNMPAAEILAVCK